jgi:hypothetical protein
MENYLSAKELEYLWTSDADASSKMGTRIRITWAGVVEDKPKYVRSISLGTSVTLQLVTTPKLKRGYFPRGAGDYLLCEITNQTGSQEAVLTIAGIEKAVEDADSWIAGNSE